MSRQLKHPDDRRRTVAFTLSKKDLERLDNVIEELMKGTGFISRSALIEYIVMQYVAREEAMDG